MQSSVNTFRQCEAFDGGEAAEIKICCNTYREGEACPLYTSDAADEEESVDLGVRRTS